MPVYRYKIITPNRSITEGKMKGFAAFWVKFKLKRDKNTILFVHRANRDVSLTKKRTSLLSMSSLQQILFFRNLSMMLDSGIALSDALRNSAAQAKGFGVFNALNNVYYEVSNGSPFSKALSRYPSIFPIYIVKTIKVGEQSGTLSQTLDRISIDLERSYELRRKVVSAISYPAIILFFMVVTAVLLIVMVLPQIVKLFADLDAELPATTKFLQIFGDFIKAYPFHIAFSIVSALVAFFLLMRIRKVRLVVHASLLRLPVFGNLLREYSLSVLTRALNTLLSSGITFVQALDTVKGTVHNESYIQMIEKMHPLVMQGGQFSDAMHISTLHFPEQLRYLVEVGESTGKLKTSFEKASAHYERSVLFQTQMLTTLLEPMLMLIAGVLVGFLALSIFGPLYSIATQM